jgi:RimJ/RimL family protein N-acetyltransferase
VSETVHLAGSDPGETARASVVGPAYSIETARLHARCWSPADAPALRAAIDDNDQHLRPWIPWMRYEPRSLEATVRWLREARAAFDADRDFRYGLFEPAGGGVIGEVVLLSRAGPGALEIGYWVDHRFVGRGLATEAAAAVTRVAFEVQRVERVEIHHSAGNDASAAVPKRLGFTLDATLRRRAHDADDVVRDLAVWSLFAHEYPASPARRLPVSARDCLGTDIPFARDESER